jgi:hypothetical protein
MGTIFFLILFFGLMPFDINFLIGLAMIFALPIIIVLPLAGILGVVLSIKLRHEWQLSLLSLFTLGVPVVYWAVGEFHRQDQSIADWYLVPYTVLTLVIPLRWFLSRRKRLLDKELSPNQANPVDAKTPRD